MTAVLPLPATAFTLPFRRLTVKQSGDFTKSRSPTVVRTRAPRGIRANYNANYYGAFARDPDGNKIEAVTYTARESF